MTLKRELLAVGIAGAISLGTLVSTFAHGPGATSEPPPSGWHQGWHMGPGMTGQGYTGQGQMPMPGPGMTGQGYMGQGQMPMPGPGMTGQGYMGQDRMPMMGPGMTGQGYMGQGHTPMMAPGKMGPGQPMAPGQGPGPGAMQPLIQDLSAAEVRHVIEHQLSWQGNPNVKVGKVDEKDDDTIVAEIVTQDGSLVQKLEVDRHTGLMRQVQ